MAANLRPPRLLRGRLARLGYGFLLVPDDRDGAKFGYSVIDTPPADPGK